MKTDRDARLEELVARYQPLIDAMQTPEARAGAIAAFLASPEELGKAAVAAALSQRAPSKRSPT